jgi:hypothetical protein
VSRHRFVAVFDRFAPFIRWRQDGKIVLRQQVIALRRRQLRLNTVKTAVTALLTI